MIHIIIDWILPLVLKIKFNPYSVLTPPGGFLYFPKINNLLNILLFTACKNNKIFDFIRKLNIMRDAVSVN